MRDVIVDEKILIYACEKNSKMIKNDIYLIACVFLFFSSMIFNSYFGAAAALLFLLCGSLVFINNIHESIKAILTYKVLIVIPIYAMISSIWSDYSLISLRGGLQLLLTTIFSIVLIFRVDKNVIVIGLGFSLLLAMSASLLSSRAALNGMTNEYSLIGIFDSKNYLATHTALSVGVALAIIFDKLNPLRIARFLGPVLLFVSSLVLLKSKSLGAIFSVMLSIILFFVYFLYQSLKIRKIIRAYVNILLALIFLSMVLMVLYAMSNGIFDDVMYSLNKDPTLTGRTYIWDRGVELIKQNPVLGSGYQSIFIVNNNVAEDIWEFAKVSSGSGFNFHNIFINIWVELGVLGLLIFVIGLVVIFYRLSNNYYFDGVYKIISVYVLFFLFSQSFLEAILFRQFTLIHFFICLVWMSFCKVKRSNF
ncbi:O-antigen ligase family protein [Shewanella sp.]|uniref:O-antigen ligase family protein n=1 Tax=Shewanella sp. TaxID=50422 RepID=UPI004048901D